MEGHIAQHMVEHRAHAVVVLPDMREHWFPRISRATVGAIVQLKAAASGTPTTNQHKERDDANVRHGMRTVETGFRSGCRVLRYRRGR